MAMIAGGYAWYIYDRQDPDKLTPDDANPSDRPDTGSFVEPNSRLWQRKEKVRAMGLYPCQPEYPGTSIGWFVQLPSRTLMKVYGSREKVTQKLLFERVPGQ